MEIEVTLDVYKALTDRLRHEGDTYADVIRDILKMDSPVEPEHARPYSAIAEALERVANFPPLGFEGFSSRGLHIPNGTKLKARYKGKVYTAQIADGQWIASDGHSFDSPSAAASAVTGNNVNGLRFWDAQLPKDRSWRRLETLRR